MEHQSDEDTALTTTPSTRKKSRSQTQSLSERMAKNWPFTRVDPKLLERAHREAKAKQIIDAEEAPF